MLSKKTFTFGMIVMLAIGFRFGWVMAFVEQRSPWRQECLEFDRLPPGIYKRATGSHTSFVELQGEASQLFWVQSVPRVAPEWFVKQADGALTDVPVAPQVYRAPQE